MYSKERVVYNQEVSELLPQLGVDVKVVGELAVRGLLNSAWKQHLRADQASIYRAYYQISALVNRSPAAAMETLAKARHVLVDWLERGLIPTDVETRWSAYEDEWRSVLRSSGW